MVDWIPVWILIPAAILFIGVYASVLYLLLKKILNRIPVGSRPFSPC